MYSYISCIVTYFWLQISAVLVYSDMSLYTNATWEQVKNKEKVKNLERIERKIQRNGNKTNDKLLFKGIQMEDGVMLSSKWHTKA